MHEGACRGAGRGRTLTRVVPRALSVNPRPVQIPSDNIEFNHAPAMKAVEITAASKEALLSGKYKVVRVNFANPDMVGHTGAATGA